MQNIPPIPWSDEERDTLRRLRENGVSIRQCADMLGRSFHSVQRAIRRVGIQRPAPPPREAAAGENGRRAYLCCLYQVSASKITQ